MTPDRLTQVLTSDRYLKSHLGKGRGMGHFYYTLSNIQAPKVCVCLGSGGGSIPALMREGQIAALYSRGRHWRVKNWSNHTTYLVDLGGYATETRVKGSTNIYDEKNIFVKNYPEIEILKMTTDDSCEHFRAKEIKIDYLHIDADHTHKQSFKDFENFYKNYDLMSEDFIITMHDTAIGHSIDSKGEPLEDGCVPRSIAEIRRKYKELEIIDFNSPCPEPGYCRGKYAGGTAIIKPRLLNQYDLKTYDFIEIGTCDFGTEIEKANDDTVGLSVEPLKWYYDALPNKTNVKKINKAVSNKRGELDMYFVSPEDIEEYRLPDWIRGSNSVNKKNAEVEGYLESKDLLHLFKTKRVPTITFGDLVVENLVGKIRLLKVDAEGHDTVIIKSVINYCDEHPEIFPSEIIFEVNRLTERHLIDECISMLEKRGYKLTRFNRRTGDRNAVLVREGSTSQ